MLEFSFEKYMGAAIEAEHSKQLSEPETQDLVIEPAGAELGGLSLSDEAKVVAEALAEADIDHDDCVGDSDLEHVFGAMHPYAMHSGWDLTAFSPNPQYSSRAINADTQIYAGLAEPILLAGGGILYHLRLNIDPFRPGRGIGNPVWVAGRECDPEHTLEENKERIRYGLARLVARHQLELPEDLEIAEVRLSRDRSLRYT
jgi:hypothetical protein